MGKIFKIESISQMHDMIGYDKPKNPLITLFEQSNIKPQNIPEITQQIIMNVK